MQMMRLVQGKTYLLGVETESGQPFPVDARQEMAVRVHVLQLVVMQTHFLQTTDFRLELGGTSV